MKRHENVKLVLKKAHGFTLMELMIVIAILAILAGIVAPRMLSQLDQANVTAAKAQINSFKTAITSYKIKYKKYPSSLDELINNSGSINFLDATTVPKDPWDNDYVYTAPGTHGMDFEIVCYGADGTSGGSDFAADIESWNLAGKE